MIQNHYNKMSTLHLIINYYWKRVNLFIRTYQKISSASKISRIYFSVAKIDEKNAYRIFYSE